MEDWKAAGVLVVKLVSCSACGSWARQYCTWEPGCWIGVGGETSLLTMEEKFRSRVQKRVTMTPGNLHGKTTSISSGCWKGEVLTALCSYPLISPFQVFCALFLSTFTFPQTRPNWNPTWLLLITSHPTASRRWWSDDLHARTTLCLYFVSRACQRATVTPLLPHHSRLTAKHPHRSVWAYLWGDCKMSMDFGLHCTDLKTLSGTFTTTNGFQWFMTSALSCF